MKIHNLPADFHGDARTATADLGLERIVVLYPGSRRYALSDTVEAVPLAELAEPADLFESAPR